MGLLNSALQVGRTALLSYEGALHVVGNNISSAGSPEYTRLTPQLDPLRGTPITGDLQPGAGVALTAIQRNINEALEGRIRLATGADVSAATRQDALAQLEALFDDFSGTGVGTQLTEFFSTLDEVQNTPEDPGIRSLAIMSGALLAESLRQLRTQLTRLADDIDAQIAAVVASADEIARKIARLNEEITTSEAGSGNEAAALRDQRDALLRDLSELFDTTVREQPDGRINVYVGNEALVQGSSVRGLVAVEEIDGESTRTSVRFADTDQQVQVLGGRLEGLILSRDQAVLGGQISAVDELASALIAEVNRIHADGQGLVGFTSVTGTNEVLATDAALDSTAGGLVFTPQNGSFFITVADDATHTPCAYRIEVDLNGTGDPTTLESLVADINASVEGVTASITSDSRFRLTAEDDYTFTFGHDGQQARQDTSHVLAALGINTFFAGADARDIEVNQALTEQSSLLAAASVFLSGDGTNAGRIAALDTAVSEQLGDMSIGRFYRSIAGSVAVASAAAREEAETAASILESLSAQRESISGVNLDEEAIALVKYERAFQGAARFVSVVDGLLRELMVIMR